MRSGFEIRVWGLGFKVYGSGFRGWGQSLWSRVLGVKGVGSREATLSEDAEEGRARGFGFGVCEASGHLVQDEPAVG